MPLHYEVKPFDQLTPWEVHEIFRLRTEVFIVEQDCAYQDVDGLDPGALHLLGRTPAGTLESYARLLPVGASYPAHAAIGRVITSPRIRGTGEGRHLMEAAIREAERAYGAAVPLKLGAQDYALDFYRRLGFEPAGEGYLEDGIPHTPMELRRPREFRRPPAPPGASSG
jgi:ElaA protein